MVVSNAKLLAEGFVWVAMITSADNPRRRYDREISDLDGAGLSAPSVVRPIKLACIEPSRILRRAGRLPAGEAKRVLASVSGFVC